MYSEILFDLDGTITFSHPGICAGVKFALEKMGIEENDIEKLKRFVGPPLWDSFERFYGLSHKDAVKCVDWYRDYYRKQGIFEFTVVPGIDSLIKELYENGRRVFLATSKPQEFAEQVIERIGITEYFTKITGSFLDGKRVEKDEVIKYIRENYDLLNPVMVGDTIFDVQGAQKNGMESVFVSYGYGENLCISDKRTTQIANSVDELRKIVL